MKNFEAVLYTVVMIVAIIATVVIKLCADLSSYFAAPALFALMFTIVMNIAAGLREPWT